jgi:hypothetical protein
MRLKAEYVYIAIFALLSLLMVVNHEPWRDEAQAWLIVRDSPSLLSVVQQMGREGTPGLWFYIAYPLAKSGLPYCSVQIVNFLFLLCAVIIFTRYAPYPHHQKILFIFGYYIMYEYSVIGRTYSLSVLLLFAIAALYKDRFRKPIAYSFLIFLLANTNVHSTVISMVLAGAYLLESIMGKDSYPRKASKMSFFIIALGFIVAICQIISREERAACWAGWHWGISRTQSSELFYALELAFLPISRPSIIFWGGKLVYYPACIFIAVPLYVASLSFLLKKRMPLVIYLCSTIGVLSIFWLKYPGARRHYGFLYISFVVSLWISECYQDKSLWLDRFINKKNLARVFTILLFLQLLGSAQAFYYEWNYDFSPGKRVAAFLRGNGYIGKDTFIATFPSTKAQAILLYIPKPYSQFFQIENERYNSYTANTRDFMRNQSMPIEEVIRRVDNGIKGKKYSKVLLILNERMDSNKDFAQRYALVASFEQHIAEDEQMYIYQLKSPSPKVGISIRP